ncbi:hypothetical protein Caci_3056 [Catenulispora acidiphila DSM 44928]|uniref:Uncharacterized protein n=1 Tax=Catenulispora acidiphila (strain DSM 44928 / JCM 14897 / NBRC 102108 / NRRL B-24433 / ID139908) TaxID=479433 RepID=C7Q4J6_CATAD|nr:hypothetical protein [Catenulispora acidiphila]ACU71965.1 hypothetical protein Caci_3056 [Catenulispora acidiphila DSM 44928]
MASQTRLKPTGLTQLAERNPTRWSWPKTGKPRIKQIAEDAGIGRVTLHEVKRGTRVPSQNVQDRLRDLAVSTGVTHSYAHKMLFEPVEIDEVAA